MKFRGTKPKNIEMIMSELPNREIKIIHLACAQKFREASTEALVSKRNQCGSYHGLDADYHKICFDGRCPARLLHSNGYDAR
jgi:hypothetical protein